MQVEEVFRYFNIEISDSDLFSRCVLCNGGQYVELSQLQLATISYNIQHRHSLKNHVYIPDNDSDSDDDGQDYFGDEAEVIHGKDHDHVNRSVQVMMTSSLTDQVTSTTLNMLTGDLKNGVR